MGEAEITTVSINVTAETEEAQKKLDAITETLRELSGAGGTTSTEITATATTIESAGNSAGKSAPKIGKFTKSLGRIAFYRAIRTALKEITQAFGEGINNIYEYSKAFDGRFAQAMNTGSTAALYFKNSLGAILAPVIERLAPLFDKVIDRLVDFNNGVAEFFARMNGDSYFLAAKKSANEYNNSLKAVKRTILGFDELNILSDDNSGAANIEDMFERIELVESTSLLAKTAEFFGEHLDAIKNGLIAVGVTVAGLKFASKVKNVITYLKEAGGILTLIKTNLGEIAAIGTIFVGISFLVSGIDELFDDNPDNDFAAKIKTVIGSALTAGGFAYTLSGNKINIAFRIALAGAFLPIAIGDVVTAVSTTTNKVSTLYDILSDYIMAALSTGGLVVSLINPAAGALAFGIEMGFKIVLKFLGFETPKELGTFLGEKISKLLYPELYEDSWKVGDPYGAEYSRSDVMPTDFTLSAPTLSIAKGLDFALPDTDITPQVNVGVYVDSQQIATRVTKQINRNQRATNT